MNYESIYACIEAIKRLGKVRMEKGDFDVIEITYKPNQDVFMVDRHYWSKEKNSVVYDTRDYSETNLQSFISNSFENELDFRNAFNIA